MLYGICKKCLINSCCSKICNKRKREAENKFIKFPKKNKDWKEFNQYRNDLEKKNGERKIFGWSFEKEKK